MDGTYNMLASQGYHRVAARDTPAGPYCAADVRKRLKRDIFCPTTACAPSPVEVIDPWSLYGPSLLRIISPLPHSQRIVISLVLFTF